MTKKSTTDRSLAKVDKGLVIPGAWMRLPIPATEADAVELVLLCKRRRAEVIQRLNRAGAKRGIKRRKRLFRQYSLCQSVRVATYAQALEGRGEKIGPKPEGTIAATEVVALGRLLALVAQPRPMLIRPLDPDGKDEGKPRTICSFHVWDRARQMLAHDGLKAITKFPAWMFVYNGGEPKALHWMGRELETTKVVLTTDFLKCFLLLPWQEVVDGLLLSEQVTKSLLFDPWKRVKVKGFERWRKGAPLGPLFFYEGAPDCAGEIGSRRGIPPGSALSTLAAQAALELMLRDEVFAKEGVRLGLYADNLIILLADPALEGPVREALTRMAVKYFGPEVGDQFLQRIDTRTPQEAFVYLGRRVRIKKGIMKLEALSEHNLRLEGRVARDIVEATTFEDHARPIRRVLGYAQRHGCAPSAARAVVEAAFTVGLTAAYSGKAKDNGKHKGFEDLEVDPTG